MCGRVSISLSVSDIAVKSDSKPKEVKDEDNDSSNEIHKIFIFKPSQNLGPGTMLPIVYKPLNNKELALMHWGITTADFMTTNIKLETVTSIFTSLLKSNRCVIYIDGFYEWTQEKVMASNSKEPYYFHNEDRSVPLVCAGLYKAQKMKNSDKEIFAFSMLTSDAGSKMKWLHTRQPVVLLTQREIDDWLDCGKSNGISMVNDLLGNTENFLSNLISIPVTTKVNQIGYNGPDCTKIKKAANTLISNFFQTSSPVKVTSSTANTSISSDKIPTPTVCSGKASVTQPAAITSPISSKLFFGDPACVKLVLNDGDKEASVRTGNTISSSSISNINSDTPIKCPFCDLDLSALTLDKRNCHVNGCMDGTKSITNYTQTVSSRSTSTTSGKRVATTAAESPEKKGKIVDMTAYFSKKR